MLKIKEGVNLLGLAPQMILACIIADQVYTDICGVECTITSGVDSKHGNHSHHYKGCAIDIRTRNVPQDLLDIVVKELQARLGKQFQVILEKDHIHIEFDPA